MMMMMMTRAPAMILAQVDLSTVEGQLSYLYERLATVEGAVVAALGVAVVVFVLPRPRGFDIVAAALLFIMSFPLHYATLLKQQNTLVGPLQTLRSVSRPVSYALLGLLLVRAFLVQRGSRSRVLGLTAISFLAFQLYFVTQVLIFDDLAKGALALFSVTAMFAVFAGGFGREMQDGPSATRALEPLGWLAVAFVAINFVQLALGFGSSFAGARFVGTAGNAQYMGTMSNFTILISAFMLSSLAPGRILRWMMLTTLVVGASFLLASGSRGNALAAMVGLVAMYRTHVGKLLGFLVVGAVALGIGVILFGSESSGAERLLDTTNTRAGVWAMALEDFLAAPMFGNISRYGSELASAGVESSLLRALATMGLVGGLLFLFPVVCMVGDAMASVRASRNQPDIRALCNFHVGLTWSLLVLNVFEGVSFGLMTLPVMLTYLTFAVGAFIRDQSREGVSAIEPRESGAHWATN